MDHLKLTVDKLSVDSITDLVTDNSCGAVSLFMGTTRDNFEGKKVLRLEYEAYEPMAIKAMKAICEEVRDKWPAVHGIAMFHRLGNVPCREASVVIAVSSPHRGESLAAVSHCIDRLKASVPIWKKEVYETDTAVWKENVECVTPSQPEAPVDKNLIQINVSSEELQKRIQNFIEKKREQVNINNIHDFIPGKSESETEDADTCARVRTQFVRRSDSKGHLKVRKVENEWGPQTVQGFPGREGAPPPPAALPASIAGREGAPPAALPASIAERVLHVERFLNCGPVPRDIYRRLKQMEDKIAYLQAVSPEYAMFWKTNRDSEDTSQEKMVDYTFSADDISRKIEQLEKINM